MPGTPDAVIGFPAPRTTNVSVPKTKIYEANLHSFKGLQKKYSGCRAECEGQMNTIFEDTVDFRSYGPQLFNHKVKLPRGPPNYRSLPPRVAGRKQPDRCSAWHQDDGAVRRVFPWRHAAGRG